MDKLAYSNKMVGHHPLEKVLISLSSLVVVLFAGGVVLPLVVGGIMLFLLMVRGGISGKVLLSLFLIPIVFISTSLLPLLFTISLNQGTFMFFIDENGSMRALELFLKSFSSIICLYFLILSTPIEQIDYLLGRMKVSLLFREILVLLYRFIFVLTDTANHIYISQKQRGGYSGFKKSLHSTALLCSSLMTGAFIYCRQAHLAVKARGGDSDFVYIHREYIFERRHLIGIFFYVVFLILLKWSDFLWLI
jgi:cobalt/nickel transport system permease protein